MSLYKLDIHTYPSIYVCILCSALLHGCKSSVSSTAEGQESKLFTRSSHCIVATVSTELCLSIPGVWSHTLSAEGLSRLVRPSFWGCWLSISYLLKLMTACVMAPYIHSASNYCSGWIKMQLHKLIALADWMRKLLMEKRGAWDRLGIISQLATASTWDAFQL